MKRLVCLCCILFSWLSTWAAKSYDNPDTIVVARDGTGEFRTIDEAIEVCRAFMGYHKVIFVKKGVYKEKLIVPQVRFIIWTTLTIHVGISILKYAPSILYAAKLTPRFNI